MGYRPCTLHRRILSNGLFDCSPVCVQANGRLDCSIVVLPFVLVLVTGEVPMELVGHVVVGGAPVPGVGPVELVVADPIFGESGLFVVVPCLYGFSPDPGLKKTEGLGYKQVWFSAPGLLCSPD